MSAFSNKSFTHYQCVEAALPFSAVAQRLQIGGMAMNLDTTIAANIRVADEKASYDAACKRLLSEKIILAWIMKSCLEEYRDCDVDEIAVKYIEGTPQVGEVAVALDESNRTSIIQGTGNEDTSLTEGTITYDIRFHATAPVSGELIRLIINIDYSDLRIIPIISCLFRLCLYFNTKNRNNSCV